MENHRTDLEKARSRSLKQAANALTRVAGAIVESKPTVDRRHVARLLSHIDGFGHIHHDGLTFLQGKDSGFLVIGGGMNGHSIEPVMINPETGKMLPYGTLPKATIGVTTRTKVSMAKSVEIDEEEVIEAFLDTMPEGDLTEELITCIDEQGELEHESAEEGITYVFSRLRLPKSEKKRPGKQSGPRIWKEYGDATDIPDTIETLYAKGENSWGEYHFEDYIYLVSADRKHFFFDSNGRMIDPHKEKIRDYKPRAKRKAGRPKKQ